VTDDRVLLGSLLAKLREQVKQAEHLVALVPRDRLGWRPELPGEAFTVGHLLGHLLLCLSGFCAVLQAAKPEALAHFTRLRDLRVTDECAPAAASERIEVYLRHIEEGFALLDDGDLSRALPTVFVPQGETVLTLFLGNLEHVINHKYQLFFYLKMLGVPVETPDLYRLRGPA
jgi:DinB superfamily